MTEEQHRDSNRDDKKAWKDNSDNEEMEGGDKETKPAAPADPTQPVKHENLGKQHLPA